MRRHWAVLQLIWIVSVGQKVNQFIKEFSGVLGMWGELNNKVQIPFLFWILPRLPDNWNANFSLVSAQVTKTNWSKDLCQQSERSASLESHEWKNNQVPWHMSKKALTWMLQSKLLNHLNQDLTFFFTFLWLCAGS